MMHALALAPGAARAGLFHPGASLALDFAARRYRGAAGGPVVGDPSLLSGWSFARASEARALNSGGVYETFASDAAAITPLGLQIEGSATNLIPNPRAEGASAPSTFPTGWSGLAAGGLTTEIVSISTVQGRETLRFRVFGTLAATVTVLMLGFSSTTAIAATSGDVFTNSVYMALVGGSLNGIVAIGHRHRWATDGTVVVSPDIKNSLTAVQQRFVSTTAAAPATTTAIQYGLYIDPATVGDVVDATFEVSWPQVVKSTFVSSPILPPVGSPAASTRAADTATITGSASYPPTSVVSFTPMALTASAVTVAQWDDGTADNRVTLSITSGGNITASVVTAGVSQAALNLGAATAGVTYKVAMRAALNDVAASMNGAAVVADASAAMPTGVTTLRLGAAAAGVNRPYSRLQSVVTFPTVKTDGELQALSAA